MNGPFKAVSGTICLIRIIKAADAIPASGAPRKTKSMLIVLVALAVVFSLAAEMAYGYFADRDEVRWVRPELAEHAAIVRAQGRLREASNLNAR
ncbi:hypothetical protein [Rhizobium ruizarguesonis]|jgi:hypothetical protein|uniref:hypothetical protein n=1 Tax=Rhizobium ruizarguesonis TaxID=2081791 RepID=UPI001031C6A1|nr:hypothetical protein [Rhizobium ruizarguesonis]MBY5854419.1 hypothetical protein [Rhizobium leguminosarum]MBY5889271.1 hypothetical protein [Rhizobium leguminosarum]QSZ03180.1 hypothetical protein J3P73_12245 [Rhizobium ruizarguesonis]TAT78529.1 hypothetical protein ELI56_10160 [Rhizobium ruizarguesonis]TAT88443.1 hypothetical protein ELI54_09660 [Rhizobium ruizarguesonis]